MTPTLVTPVIVNLSDLPWGVITLDGIQYIERHQLFGMQVRIDTENQIITNQRLTLPGQSDFLLKGLGRDVTQPGLPDSQDERFRFKLWSGEGTSWYFSGGLWVFDDRVVDTLCFGNAQFPLPLVPPVPVHANGSLFFEVEDMGLRSPSHYPYIIHLAFYGTYLIPLNGASSQGR